MNIRPGLSRKFHHMGGREYGGCLTPSEILELPETGARMNNPSDLARAKERMAMGQSSPWWVYFELSSPLGSSPTKRRRDR